MTVTLDRPWLSFDLGQEMQVLSWSLNRPGFVMARQILWREVRNADLPVDRDARAWLIGNLARRGTPEAVAFLTSRDVTRHHFGFALDHVERMPVGFRHRRDYVDDEQRQHGQPVPGHEADAALGEPALLLAEHDVRHGGLFWGIRPRSRRAWWALAATLAGFCWAFSWLV